MAGTFPSGNNQGLRLTQTASNVTLDVIVVPEPGTLALAGCGVALAGWMAARRRRQRWPTRHPLRPGLTLVEVLAVIAMQGYHQADGTFPSASLTVNRGSRSGLNSPTFHWTMLIWPHLDLKTLADAYDWGVGFRGSGSERRKRTGIILLAFGVGLQLFEPNHVVARVGHPAEIGLHRLPRVPRHRKPTFAAAAGPTMMPDFSYFAIQ